MCGVRFIGPETSHVSKCVMQREDAVHNNSKGACASPRVHAASIFFISQIARCVFFSGHAILHGTVVGALGRRV